MTKHFLPDVFGRGSGSDMFSTLQREIDRVFQDFGRTGLPGLGEFGRHAMAMKVNVAEHDGALEITAEMPGCAPEDIDVQLKDGVLTRLRSYFSLSFLSFHNSRKPKPKTRTSTRSISEKMMASGLMAAVFPAS